MSEPQRLDDSTIEQARSAQSLVGLVARRVQLRRAGRGWKGLCPFHKEGTPSFTVSDEKGFYHCFGCGAHGDAIRWLQDAEGLAFKEAVASLLGGQLPDARRAIAPAERERLAAPSDYVASATAGRWIFRTSGPARGEIVERWLEARGLDPDAEFLGEPVIEALRFHPRCPVSAWRVDQEPQDARLTAPAMIAPIRDEAGAVWGVHVTYLSPDGRSKANLPSVGGRERPTRKMFGKVGGNAVFLTSPESICSRAPLIVGEGIETVWSYAQQFRRPCRAIATLSLENLQGQAIKLRDGSLPLWKIEHDPERGPFVLELGTDQGEVIILVDADMKVLRDQKVQLARGAKPVRADISGIQRAEICAALACQVWRRAGATSVRAVRPRMGSDFNDELRAA